MSELKWVKEVERKMAAADLVLRWAVIDCFSSKAHVIEIDKRLRVERNVARGNKAPRGYGRTWWGATAKTDRKCQVRTEKRRTKKEAGRERERKRKRYRQIGRASRIVPRRRDD